jgi:hypothetical protein
VSSLTDHAYSRESPIDGRCGTVTRMMVTKARVAAQKPPSKTAELATRSSTSLFSNAFTIISGPVAPATPGRERAGHAKQNPQTLPQPPTPPQPQIANTTCTGPKTQVLAPVPASTPPQTLTAGLQTQSCLPGPTSAPTQTPTASTTGLQTLSCLSTPCPVQPQLGPGTQSCAPIVASAPRGVVQRVFDKFVAWITIAAGLAAIVVAVYYGAVMLTYARWTKHNDFREGCINDRDHNLPLSPDCVSELMLPRISAGKRQIEAAQDAHVDNALRWTVAICIPVLTYVLCLLYGLDENVRPRQTETGGDTGEGGSQQLDTRVSWE